MSWHVIIDGAWAHVLPVEDERKHQLSPHCWCHPWQEHPNVWVHNSADEREKFETRERLKS